MNNRHVLVECLVLEIMMLLTFHSGLFVSNNCVMLYFCDGCYLDVQLTLPSAWLLHRELVSYLSWLHKKKKRPMGSS